MSAFGERSNGAWYPLNVPSDQDSSLIPSTYDYECKTKDKLVQDMDTGVTGLSEIAGGCIA